MLTQCWTFQSTSWSGSKAKPNMVQTWSQCGLYMVSKSKNSIDMGLGPCRLRIENFKSTHSIDISLRISWLPLDIFRAVADLEVKLSQTWSQHRLEMALIWSKNEETPYIQSSDHMDQYWKFHNFSGSVTKARPNLVQTCPWYGPKK